MPFDFIEAGENERHKACHEAVRRARSTCREAMAGPVLRALRLGRYADAAEAARQLAPILASAGMKVSDIHNTMMDAMDACCFSAQRGHSLRLWLGCCIEQPDVEWPIPKSTPLANGPMSRSGRTT